MGSAIMDSDYKCSLGEDALKKAKKELRKGSVLEAGTTAVPTS